MKAELDVNAALAWRDFMVSNYSDAGQERWLKDHGIELLRGFGRLSGVGVVEVNDVSSLPTLRPPPLAPLMRASTRPSL